LISHRKEEVPVTYVKWVANADRHNDWTSKLLLNDGTEVTMGVPVDLKADVVKSLEAEGRVFEKSSKDESDEYNAQPEVIQPPGNDVMGTAPVFVNSGPGFNQTSVIEDEAEDVPPAETHKPAAKAPARGSSNS
jgi:hypothetical protein